MQHEIGNRGYRLKRVMYLPDHQSQRVDGQVNEIAFIRAVPSLLSSFCSNTKLEQKLDSFVTKSGLTSTT